MRGLKINDTNILNHLFDKQVICPVLDDTTQETLFLKQALEGFNDAYIKEIISIYGFQKNSLMYLLGELNRKLGNYQKCIIMVLKDYC